jgi:hypothetical protein
MITKSLTSLGKQTNIIKGILVDRVPLDLKFRKLYLIITPNCSDLVCLVHQTRVVTNFDCCLWDYSNWSERFKLNVGQFQSLKGSIVILS